MRTSFGGFNDVSLDRVQPRLHALSKVKGHADEFMVAAVDVSAVDLLETDRAETAARSIPQGSSM